MNEERASVTDAEKMREMAEERASRRLTALEGQLKTLRARVRLLGVGLVVALGVAAVLALGPGYLGVLGERADEGVVRTRRLVVEDAGGVARGEWRVDEEGNSRLVLLDRQETPRLSLSVLSSGSPGMSLIDVRGERRAGLVLLPDETSSLVLADESGLGRAVLTFNRSGGAHLVFADANGDAQVGIGVDGGGVGTMLLPGEEGVGAWEDPAESAHDSAAADVFVP